MGLRQINGKWRIDLRIGGRRHRHTLAEGATREQAIEAQGAILKATRGHTGATLRDAYIVSLATRFHGKKDKDGVEDRWRVLTDIISEDTPLAAIDSRMILDAITTLRRRVFKGKPLTEKTINKKLSLLRVLFAEAVKQKPPLIREEHVPNIPHLREDDSHRRRPLKREEEDAAVAWMASQADAQKWGEFLDFFILLLDTGCRKGEALRLQARDVDLAAGRHGRVQLWETKNGQPRAVPLTPRVRLMLERRLQGKQRDGLIFPGITKAVAFDRWDECRRALGFPEVVIHGFRHTAGTRLIESGVNLRKVQAFLGHKRIETTVRYTHLTANSLDECADALAGEEGAPIRQRMPVSTDSEPEA